MSRYCYWSRLSKGICYVYCFSFAPSSKRRSRGPTSLLHSALRYPRLVNRSLFPRFFPAFSGARFFNGSIEPCCILWKFKSYLSYVPRFNIIFFIWNWSWSKFNRVEFETMRFNYSKIRRLKNIEDEICWINYCWRVWINNFFYIFYGNSKSYSRNEMILWSYFILTCRKIR